MRKKRIWYAGAIYHVMQRGVHRSEIFRNDEDYEIFLVILEHELKRCDCCLYAFCLMTNHYHLLVKTNDTPIWNMMQVLSSSYAKYYNKAHEFCGHLFENRYTSCLVEDETYLLHISRYIHLNPVKAHMIGKPEDYRWSSYRHYLGLAEDKITVTDRVMESFCDRVAYQKFVDVMGHKYEEQELKIREGMKEDDLWLPW